MISLDVTGIDGATSGTPDANGALQIGEVPLATARTDEATQRFL